MKLLTIYFKIMFKFFELAYLLVLKVLTLLVWAVRRLPKQAKPATPIPPPAPKWSRPPAAQTVKIQPQPKPEKSLPMKPPKNEPTFSTVKQEALEGMSAQEAVELLQRTEDVTLIYRHPILWAGQQEERADALDRRDGALTVFWPYVGYQQLYPLMDRWPDVPDRRLPVEIELPDIRLDDSAPPAEVVPAVVFRELPMPQPDGRLWMARGAGFSPLVEIPSLALK